MSIVQMLRNRALNIGWLCFHHSPEATPRQLLKRFEWLNPKGSALDLLQWLINNGCFLANLTSPTILFLVLFLLQLSKHTFLMSFANLSLKYWSSSRFCCKPSFQNIHLHESVLHYAWFWLLSIFWWFPNLFFGNIAYLQGFRPTYLVGLDKCTYSVWDDTPKELMV